MKKIFHKDIIVEHHLSCFKGTIKIFIYVNWCENEIHQGGKANLE